MNLPGSSTNMFYYFCRCLNNELWSGWSMELQEHFSLIVNKELVEKYPGINTESSRSIFHRCSTEFEWGFNKGTWLRKLQEHFHALSIRVLYRNAKELAQVALRASPIIFNEEAFEAIPICSNKDFIQTCTRIGPRSCRSIFHRF